MELLIGAGSRREKIVSPTKDLEWRQLVTLDNNPLHRPDVLWDLNQRPLPFEDEAFDEIHAYEVLEHLGKGIGDHESWFAEWTEWWRLLKPGGYLCGSSPALTSRWLWGDPSHRRVVSAETMTFLNQPAYTDQVGKTPMSDFRNIYQADFDVYGHEREGSFFFMARAVKPSRISL